MFGETRGPTRAWNTRGAGTFVFERADFAPNIMRPRLYRFFLTLTAASLAQTMRYVEDVCSSESEMSSWNVFMSRLMFRTRASSLHA